jgi:hypothetical protein
MKLLPSKYKVLPRTHKFWSLFAIETDLIAQACRLLLDAVEAGTSELEFAATEIKTIERKSNENLEEIQQNLCKTFITPIDPEDISMLGEQLDCVCRELETIAYRLAAYGISPTARHIVGLAQTADHCGQLLKKAFSLFSVRNPVDDSCNRVLNIGEEAGQLIREGVKALFAEEKDPIALVKREKSTTVLNVSAKPFSGWRVLCEGLRSRMHKGEGWVLTSIA